MPSVTDYSDWPESLARYAPKKKHLGPGNHPSGSPQDVHGGGGTAVADDDITEEESVSLAQRAATDGGFTYQPIKDKSPTKGFAIAMFPEKERILDSVEAATPAAIFAYMQENAELLRGDQRVHVGAWHNKKTSDNPNGDDKVYLDLSMVIDDRDEAMSLAKENGQLGLFDLENFQTVETMTPDERRQWEDERGRQSKAYVGPGGRLRSSGNRHLDGASRSRAKRGRDRGVASDGQGPRRRSRWELMLALSKLKHLGPGNHPSGSPQEVHGHGGGGGAGQSPVSKLQGKNEEARKAREAIVKRKAEAYKKAKDGPDTISQFMLDFSEDEGPKFTPERQELHDAIVHDVLADGNHEFQGETKVLTVLGGGGGAGKSTLLRNGHVPTGGSITVNPDDLKNYLPEYREGVERKDPTVAGMSHEESSYLSKRIMKEAEKQGFDYVLDGTGDSTIEKLRKKLSHAKQQGYVLSAQYVTVDTQTALDRNLARAAKTGRMVPPAALKHAHEQVSKVFPQAIAEGLFDDAKLWDTNDSTLEEDKTELVAEYKEGKFTVYNQQKYDRFLAKATSE